VFYDHAYRETDVGFGNCLSCLSVAASAFGGQIYHSRFGVECVRLEAAVKSLRLSSLVSQRSAWSRGKQVRTTTEWLGVDNEDCFVTVQLNHDVSAD
jgi:hypothetical protein